MTYYTEIFSPETYEAFTKSDRTVVGHLQSRRNAAERVKPGDRFVCYLTKLSRWVGLLEVLEGPFEDDSPVFHAENDPYSVRFRVKPLVWLPIGDAVPIRDDSVWPRLSFTRQHDVGSATWTAALRSSLLPLDESDGSFLESLLSEQCESPKAFPYDAE